jgi:hypothetical protein
MDLDRSPKKMAADWRSELAPGGPYFTVSYHEGGVNLPEIETLVYLGSAQMEGQARIGLLFQTAQSYQQDGDWSELPEERRTNLAADGAVMFYDENSVGLIADIDGLLMLLGGLRERIRRGLGWDHVLPEQ